MRHLWIVSALLLVGLAFRIPSGGPELTICGELDEPIVLALEARGVRVEARDAVTVLDLSHKDQVVAGLCQALLNTQRERDLVHHNLANSKTTKTVSGEPYRRRVARYTPNGQFTVEIDPSDFSYVYSPDHPDAYKDGCKAGYVAYPNINTIEEITTLKQLEIRESFLRQCLRRVAPDMLVPELRMSSRVEPQPSSRLTAPQLGAELEG